MNDDSGVIGTNRNRTALIFFGLFALTVAAFSFCLNLPFMCDDFFGIAALSGERYYPNMDRFFYNIHDYIVPSVEREFPQTVPWWTSPDTKLAFLRTFSGLTLKLDYLIWGKNPFGFHLTNIMIHGLACAFLFLIGRILFRRDLVAAVGALVFTGHMSHAFVVPWVAERASVLSMLLGLMGLYAHILYRKGKGGRWELFAWLLFILAFFTRESGSTCLITYFLYDLFLWRKECPEQWPGIVRSFLYYCMLSIPLFLFIAYFVYAGYGVEGYYTIADGGASTTELILYIVKNLFFYAQGLLFFMIVGNETNVLLFQKWYYYGPFLVLLVLGALLFLPAVRRKFFKTSTSKFLLSWLLISLLPILYLLTQNRYLYPATAPFGLFIAYYLFEMKNVKGFGKRTNLLVVVYLVFLIVLPLLGMNIKHSTFTKVFSFQTHMVQETQALLDEAGVPVGDNTRPVHLFFTNVPSAIYLLAIQNAFDFYMGHANVVVFPLTVGHDVPEVTLLGDRSLLITSHSDPFLEHPGERLFMSRTVVPNRVGFSTGNKFVRGTVEKVEDGHITAIRFDFPEKLNDERMRFFYYKDRQVQPLAFPEDLKPGPLLAPHKSSRE
jgi:hypothetical protein